MIYDIHVLETEWLAGDCTESIAIEFIINNYSGDHCTVSDIRNQWRSYYDKLFGGHQFIR